MTSEMTDTHMNRPPVTVPVGIGGKTTPYVPDPAPTLVIEFPSVETITELARIASLEAEARDNAERIIDEARTAAEEMRREAAEAADEIRSTIETERQTVLGELATEREAVEAERAEVAQLSAALDARESEVETRRSALDDRLARADADLAEAARILADAREGAQAIMDDAQETADSIIQEAVSQAQSAAAELVGEARDSVDAETLISQRLAEAEALHRVEVQVLTEREAELLHRIAHLEATLASASDRAEETTDSEAGDEHVADSPPRIAVEAAESGARNGRHTTEIVDMSARPISSHATLTEQLSTSAFRTADRDRKGRRRR